MTEDRSVESARPESLGERFSSASDLFKEHDSRLAVIVGSGTSLATMRFEDLMRPWIYTFAINHEPWRNSDKYIPNSWIFFDKGVAIDHGSPSKCRWCGGNDEISDSTTVFSRKKVIDEIIAEGRSPRWMKNLRIYENEYPWEPHRGKVYMNKTTATAALSLAIEMGFKTVAMLGVDLYAPENGYYYHGVNPKNKITPRPSQKKFGEKRIDAQHQQMLGDFSYMNTRMKKLAKEVKVYQCSMGSPLDCFEKAPWQEVVRRYGR